MTVLPSLLNRNSYKLFETKKKPAINCYKGRSYKNMHTFSNAFCLIYSTLYLQLVELEQITITIERRQQTTLLQSEVRSPTQRYHLLGGVDGFLRKDLPPVSIKTDTQMFTPAALEYLSRWKLGGQLCVVDILLFIFDTDSVETFAPSGAASVVR